MSGSIRNEFILLHSSPPIIISIIIIACPFYILTIVQYQYAKYAFCGMQQYANTAHTTTVSSSMRQMLLQYDVVCEGKNDTWYMKLKHIKVYDPYITVQRVHGVPAVICMYSTGTVKYSVQQYGPECAFTVQYSVKSTTLLDYSSYSTVHQFTAAPYFPPPPNGQPFAFSLLESSSNRPVLYGCEKSVFSRFMVGVLTM